MIMDELTHNIDWKNSPNSPANKRRSTSHDVLLPCATRSQASFLLWKSRGFPCKVGKKLSAFYPVAGFVADNYDFLVVGMFLALFFWRVTRRWRGQAGSRPGRSCSPGGPKVVHFGGGSPLSSLPRFRERENRASQDGAMVSAHGVLVGRICVKVNMLGERPHVKSDELSHLRGPSPERTPNRISGSAMIFRKLRVHSKIKRRRRWGNALNRAEPSAIRWAEKLKLDRARASWCPGSRKLSPTC